MNILPELKVVGLIVAALIFVGFTVDVLNDGMVDAIEFAE